MTLSGKPHLDNDLANMSHKNYFPTFDGLRGIAIILVLLLHASNRVPLKNPDLLDGIFHGVTQFGWIGVDLFFVLSGFLITGILIDAKNSESYFLNFYARRTLRIFPVYYFFLIAFFLILPSLVDSNRFQEIKSVQIWHFFYIQNWILLFNGGKVIGGEWIGHLWSLAVEEQFYLVWPVVIYSLSRKKLAIVCIICICAAPFYRYFTFENVSNFFPYINTLARIDTLAVGALLAVCFRDDRVYSLVKKAIIPTIILSTCLLALIIYQEKSTKFINRNMVIYGYTLISLTFGSILICSIETNKKNFFHKVLLNKYMKIIGKYSYSIYVFHLPVMTYFRNKQLNWLFPDSYIISYTCFFAISFFVSIVFSKISWELLEKHFLGLKKYFRTGQTVVLKGLARERI